MFILDLDSYHLRYGDQSIRLTKTEAGILTVLMRWPGHVKTREQILNIAWADNINVLDRAVDSQIRTIRNKARAAFGKFDVIRPISGVGYIFEGDAEIKQHTAPDVITFSCQWAKRSVDEAGRTQWDCKFCGGIHLSMTPPDRCLEIGQKNRAERRAHAALKREAAAKLARTFQANLRKIEKEKEQADATH